MASSSRPTRWTWVILSLLIPALSLLIGPVASGQVRLSSHSSGVSTPSASEQGGALSPSATKPGDQGPWVVRAYYDNRQMVNDLAAWREPWEVHHDKGYLVVDVNEAEYQRLLDAGFELEIDEQLTTRLDQPNVRLPGQTTGIPGYLCYRTVEETFAAAQEIVAGHPDLATWIDVGDSWGKVDDPANGYDMMVLRLTNAAISGPKPKLFVMTSVHAREYAPAELSTRFAEYLADNYELDPDVTWLLDYHEIHLLLQANPDGRKKAEIGLLWRKNINENYCSPISNDRGADLNRNFEFQWGCCGGSSGDECDETYRGPSVASEPETQVIQAYVRAQFPDQREEDLEAAVPITATGVFLDIHSYGELVLWPWGFTYDQAPNSAALQTLGRKFAYLNGYEPDQAVGLYPTDGTTDDFAYGDLGLAAYTFEVGTSFFQDCATFESIVLPHNLSALIYAAKVSRAPYLTPAGPDALDVAVSPASATPGEVVQLTTIIDDTRYNNANGVESTQNIVAAEYYIDVPPWNITTVSIPNLMTAVDGGFDEKIEGVEASVDANGLGAGRHILFVRGQDADGNWGALSAVFLYITEPSISPVIEGHVRDAKTGAPLEATLTAGVFRAETHLATGYYSMTVVSGTYNLSAVAASHVVSTVADVVAQDYQIVQQDFYLYPTCGILVDDVESGDQSWVAQSPWTMTDEVAHSPSHSWTDSTASNYGNNRDISLTSPALDLSGYRGVTLSFWHVYDLEQDYDYGYVEYSVDGGEDWVEVASYTGGDQTNWARQAFDLSALDGQPDVHFRFRLSSDRSVTADGWHIDDVMLSGGGSDCVLTSTYGVALAAMPPAQTAYVGQSVDYVLQVTNQGSTSDRFRLEASGHAWTTTMAVTTTSELLPLDSTDVQITVDVPLSAGVGQTDTVTLTATSQGDNTQSASVTLTTTAVDTLSVYGVMVEPVVDTRSGLPGTTVSYTLTVRNLNTFEDSFAVTINDPAWRTITSTGIIGTLAIGATDTLKVYVTIPVTATDGMTDTVIVTLTSREDATQSASSTLTTTASMWLRLYLPLVLRNL